MFEQNEDACTQALECGGIDVLAMLLGQAMLPIELKLLLINMLNSMAKHKPMQRKVMSYKMAGQLFGTLEVIFYIFNYIYIF